MTLFIVLIALLAAAGLGLIVAGISMLAGTAWALIVAGVFVFAFAAILRGGLIRNG